MKLGIKAKFKVEYLANYPLVNITEKHLDIQEGYKLAGVSLIRPSLVSNTLIAKLTLTSPHDGDLIHEDLELTFDKSEADRLAHALQPDSFKVRDNALLIDPRKITPADVVNKFEDVIILTAAAKKTDVSTIWNLHLKVRFVHTELPIDVVIPVNYNELDHISLTGMIPIKDLAANVSTVNHNQMVTFDQVLEVVPDPAFFIGSPPVTVPPHVIKAFDGFRLLRVEYWPPSSIDDRNAAFRVEFENKKTGNQASRLIGFQFGSTIREAANRAMQNTYETEFNYLPKNRLVAPLSMQPEEFEYVGPLQGVEIVDVLYNYNALVEDRRFITATLVIEYKTINYKITKTLEFAYSKLDYLTGNARATIQESQSVSFKEKHLHPMFLFKVATNNKAAIREFIDGAKINPAFPYTKIKEVKIVRFAPNSRVVIFAIKAEEQRGNKKVIHYFEKTQELTSTFNDALLERMTPDDIKINYDFLPVSPDGEFDESIFIVPAYAALDSILYVKPNWNEKVVKVQLKFKAENKFIFMEKVVTFEKSINEYRKYLSDQEEYEYLKTINPEDLVIDVDLSDYPVSKITPSQIYGAPSGVDVEVDYIKPKFGQRIGRIYVHLLKGQQCITFEQTLQFAKSAK